MKCLFSFTIGAILIFVGSTQGANTKVVCTTAGEIIPNPEDCHSYYYCTTSLDPEMHYCPSGYDFDVISGQCQTQSVVTCATGTTTPSTPLTSTANPTDPFACQHASQVVPYPFDCETFFICDAALMTAHYYKCDPGFYYDPTYGNCNSAAKVTCASGVRPTPFPTAIPPSTTAPPEVELTCTAPAAYPGLLVPDPDPANCRAWWKCNAVLTPELFVCPSGLKFNHYEPMKCVDELVALCN